MCSLLPALFTISTTASTLYVKPNSVSAAWKNKTSVYTDLQKALSVAVSGDEIWVTQGNYKPTDDNDRTISFELMGGVKLLGGFAGTETSSDERNWRKHPTILSGNIGKIDEDTDNSYHVLICNTDAPGEIHFDGFIVEKGFTNNWNTTNHNGGGLELTQGELVITNSIFRENYASSYGGAIFSSNSTLQCINSIFTSNISGKRGGAIYLDNKSTSIQNFVLEGNLAEWEAGAIYSSNYKMEISNSILYNNTAYNNPANINKGKVTYSCIEGGYPGEGNIANHPMFIDASSGDFRLNANSPCINRGNNDSIPQNIFKDFALNKRIQQDTVDIGVLEGGVVTPIQSSPANQQNFKGEFMDKEITFKWNWNADSEQPLTEKYILQYWKHGGDTISVEVTSTMEYTTELSAASNYRWRVGSVSGGNRPRFSIIQSFTISHYHPLYVKEGATGYGVSWSRAYGDLQSALSAAVYGDEIWVAAGTYKPTNDSNPEKYFTPKQGIKIYGGFAGNESDIKNRNWQVNKTILSADIGLPNDNSDNSYHVLYAAYPEDDLKEGLVLDGLIIQDCNGKNNNGGGIYLENISGSITNCIIRNNRAHNRGAGLYLSNGNYEISNCIFQTNESKYNAGGLYVEHAKTSASISGCTFYENRGEYHHDLNGSNNTFVSNTIFLNSKNNNITGSKITFSCMQGYHFGTGNIKADPLFVDAENGNFCLMPNSPCINSGINDSIPENITNDFHGFNRKLHDTVDMGACEAAYPITTKPHDNISEKPALGGSLDYAWTLGANNQSGSSFPNLINPTNYKITLKIWEKDVADNIFEEVHLQAFVYFSENFEYNKGYQWKVGVKTEDYTYWSDTATFYIGKEHPLYVKAGASGDGSSWNSAYGTITEALNHATKGDEIWVAKGTYKPTSESDRDASFEIGDYIGLYGGFNGNETTRYVRNHIANKTVLSGDIGQADDNSDNSKHIISIKGTASDPREGSFIEGFTIEAGNASSENGGAILSEYASYNLQNCIIANNKASRGGAIYNAASSPFIYNTLFHNNKAVTQGGAICSDDNSSPEIINCTIAKNS